MKKSYKKVKYAVKHLQSFLFHLSGLESNILKHNILMIFNFIIHFLCLNEANVLQYYIHSTIYTWFFELQIPYAFYFFLSLKKPLDWTYNCQVLLYSRVSAKEYTYISDRRDSTPLRLPNICLTQPLPALSAVYSNYLSELLSRRGEVGRVLLQSM